MSSFFVSPNSDRSNLPTTTTPPPDSSPDRRFRMARKSIFERQALESSYYLPQDTLKELLDGIAEQLERSAEIQELHHEYKERLKRRAEKNKKKKEDEDVLKEMKTIEEGEKSEKVVDVAAPPTTVITPNHRYICHDTFGTSWQCGQCSTFNLFASSSSLVAGDDGGGGRYLPDFVNAGRCRTCGATAYFPPLSSASSQASSLRDRRRRVRGVTRVSQLPAGPVHTCHCGYSVLPMGTNLTCPATRAASLQIDEDFSDFVVCSNVECYCMLRMIDPKCRCRKVKPHRFVGKTVAAAVDTFREEVIKWTELNFCNFSNP